MVLPLAEPRDPRVRVLGRGRLELDAVVADVDGKPRRVALGALVVLGEGAADAEVEGEVGPLAGRLRVRRGVEERELALRPVDDDVAAGPGVGAELVGLLERERALGEMPRQCRSTLSSSSPSSRRAGA